MARSLPVLAIALVAGCSQWPRMANLPNTDGVEPGDRDPSTLVEVNWPPFATAEVEDNDQPPGQIGTNLLVGQAMLVSGTLDGVGFIEGTPQRYESTNKGASCSSTTGVRTPVPDLGDYAGDVDFFLAEIAEPGVLCARVLLQQDLAFDFVVYELDKCNIPTEPLSVDGQILGLDQVGRLSSWALPVAIGKTYAIGLAGFATVGGENDLNLAVDYDLGFALTSASSTGGTICPVLPIEDGGAN